MIAELWAQFVNLYNGNPAVQLLSILGFWFLFYSIFTHFYRKKRPKGTNHALIEENDRLKKELEKAHQSSSDSFWKKKKELYDYLRKTVRDFGTTMYAKFDSELLSRVNQIGVQTATAINWEETQEWEAFFRSVGSMVAGRLFDDIEGNGFESIGEGESNEDAAVTRYIEGKVSYLKSMIQQALIQALQKQSFYRKDADIFLPRKRWISHTDLTYIISQVQPTIEEGVRRLYQEAITSSKRLYKQAKTDSQRVDSEMEE